MAHKTATEMVAEAKSRIENLSVEDVTSEVEQGDPILVDIRESEERAASGTIHGAVAAPRGMLEFWADPSSPYHREEFDPNKRTILYCASGGRSALATDALQQMGYANTAHLDGGFTAWKEAGQQIDDVS